MPKKTTLRGQFLRTSLEMLGLSLLIGLGLMAAVMTCFVLRVPDGGQFLADSFSFVFGKETMGPSGMVPFLILAGVLLCLLVAGVCILLTSRLTGKITATLKTLRQAADNLRDGDLDFQILSCDQRELDELSQSLESVRQRLKAAAVAEAAAQDERGLLMANLSHDLRTPITAIKGYVEGIQDGIANTPEKQAHYLQIIYNKSVVLEKLVRNMSDFSEYELGRMQYHFEYVDMGPFLRDLGEEYRDDVEQNGLSLVCQIPTGHYVVTADRGKLKRVLDNLISNAIKYSRPQGSIALTAEEYERGLVIQVSDNGKGIGTQALRHVFDSFFREDAARTSSVPGSGLGLAICRSIVDSHHGKIWLTSEEGEGTRAFIYLPLQKEEGLL
ncbi:MAG: HAMP domain-containing histidine kinase [Clostridiales bacterium]|nr:HAMP domain-containing histidine kinase [Clostridiales bacterium]